MGGNGRSWISKNMEEMISIISNEDLKISLIIAATQAGLQDTIIWMFLKREINLHPYKLHMRQEANDKDKLNWTRLAIYHPNDLRNIPNFLKRMVLSDECEFPLPGLVNKQTVWYESQRLNLVYQVPDNGTSVMV